MFESSATAAAGGRGVSRHSDPSMMMMMGEGNSVSGSGGHPINEDFPPVEAESGENMTSVAGVNIARLVDLDNLGFTLEWDEHNVTDQVVAGASLAGHIALHNPIEPGVVSFYDSRGTKLHVLQLPAEEAEGQQRIVYMCWNNVLQHLIVMTQSGAVYFRQSTGRQQAASDIQLPSPPVAWAPTDHGVCVCVGGEGKYELVNISCLEQLEEYTVRRFCPARGMQLPNAMVVIPSNHAQSTCDETYLVCNADEGNRPPTHVERIVWRSSRASAAQYTSFATPSEVSDAVACMSVSPDGKSIAMLLADGTVLSARPDFREIKVVGQALDISGLNYQFEWFGNDCVALINHNEEECLGTLFSVRSAGGYDGGDAKSVDVELPVGSWAIVEPDGLRLVSGNETRGWTQHKFWQVIPAEVTAFYQRPTSRAGTDSTQLRVAYNAFRRGDAQCASVIKSLSAPGSTERLVRAISDTLQVACYEWDPNRQRDVLRVASYGKVFCPVFDSQKFFDVCRRSRVAHSLRHKANIIASLHQLRLLDGEPLINRLINIGELSLACDVASVLNLKNDVILERWAALTVSKAKETGMQIFEIRSFIEGLMKKGTFNLEPAVNAAVDTQLPREALAELIRLEKRTDKQMQYYLANCRQYPDFAEQALLGAAASGDSDVLFDCLMRVPLSRELLGRLPEISGNLDATAAQLVRFSPSAVDSDPRLVALSSVLNEHDAFFTVSLCLQQYFLQTAKLRVDVSRGAKLRVPAVLGTLRSSIQSAAIAVQTNVQARSKVPGSSSSATTGAIVLDAATKDTVRRLEEQEGLIKEQQGLFDATSNEGFLGASLARTISLCIQLDMTQKADQLATQYGVSKKMLAWARLNGAIARGRQVDINANSEGENSAPSIRDNFDAAYRLIDQWFGKDCVLGYGALVQALIDAEQLQFATLYIKKVGVIEERLEFWVKCKKWREAAEDCKKEGVPQYVAQLKARAQGDSFALSQIASVGV